MSVAFKRKPLDCEGVMFDGKNISELMEFAIGEGYPNFDINYVYADERTELTISNVVHRLEVGTIRKGSALISIEGQLHWANESDLEEYWDVEKT